MERMVWDSLSPQQRDWVERARQAQTVCSAHLGDLGLSENPRANHQIARRVAKKLGIDLKRHGWITALARKVLY